MSTFEKSHSTNELQNVREFPEVPRDPNEYAPDQHFVVKKKERNIAGWIIRYLIENGKIISLKGDNHYFFKAKLSSYKKDSTEIVSHNWILPIVLTHNQKNERKHVVKTAPYIQGKQTHEVKEINPFRPNEIRGDY